MATRIKTVKYSVPTYTAVVADATVTNLAQITLYIPEASPTFVSVTTDVAFQDVITASGGTIGEHRVGLQLNASGYNTYTDTDDITQSGENIGGVIGPVDFTSYFNSNWTGTSSTLDLQVYFDQTSGTTLGMRNVNAEVTITYSYDDDPSTNPTQIKTVYIPLESLAGALTTTANSNIGSNQVPVLTGAGGFLSEDAITIRDFYFLIEGNVQNNNTTTDFTLSCNIDSGTSFSFGVVEAGMGSDYYTRLIYKPAIPTTTSSHNFQMWSSVANKMNHTTVTLVITYEFAPSTSSTILNSIKLPFEIGSPLGITTAANASRMSRDLYIQEPGTVSLLQSAFRVNWNTTTAISGLAFRAGSQAFRNYTNLGNAIGGMFSLQQRIDSGSTQGAGISFARGKNTIAIDGYSTDASDQATNINGYVILNYHSDKAASGLVGQHAHTTEYLVFTWDALLVDRRRVDGYSIAIPETNYRLMEAGFYYYMWQSTASNAITFDVQANSGEGKGAGYYDIYADAVQTDAERGSSVVYMRGRDVFKRYPQDPDTERLDIEVARSYRIYNAATASTGMMAIVTYHSFSYTVADSITGFSGAVDLTLFRSSNDEKLGETSRSGDGAFSFTWYDNTDPVYVVANDGTNVGRSTDDLAV